MKARLARAKDQEAGAKIKPDDFWQIEEPTLQEKLILDLSKALETQKDKDYVSVSWASQLEAINYYNEHGFEKTLARLVELQ